MQRITDILTKYNLDGIVIAGLSNMVGENKTSEIWSKLNGWKFSINHRAAGRLGQCNYRQKKIEISDVLLRSEHAEKRNSTLLHEIAHAVDPMINGRHNGHGQAWRRIMVEFGQKPTRCNDDDTVSEALKEKKKAKCNLMYACTRCELEFPAMRKKKYAASNYRHRNCGTLYLKQDVDGRKFQNPMTIVATDMTTEQRIKQTINDAVEAAY